MLQYEDVEDDVDYVGCGTNLVFNYIVNILMITARVTDQHVTTRKLAMF